MISIQRRMQLPSIASLLNHDSNNNNSNIERVTLPSVKELDSTTTNTLNTLGNTRDSNIHQTSSYTCSTSTGGANGNGYVNGHHHHQHHYPNSGYYHTSEHLSNNNSTTNYFPPHHAPQLDQHACTPIITTGRRIRTTTECTNDFDIAAIPTNNNLKYPTMSISSPPHPNMFNTANCNTQQPIPIFNQNKFSTASSAVVVKNEQVSTLSPTSCHHSSGFKPLVASPSRSSPLSFATTTTSNSSNVSSDSSKKKRKLDESCVSETCSPNSPKLMKRNSSTSSSTTSSLKKSNSSPSGSFQFMNFSISSETSKIKFVNSEHQQIGINDGSWTDKEHDDFIRGLEECGKGRWREIAEKYVKTRTRTQVASHAQKYFESQKVIQKKK